MGEVLVHGVAMMPGKPTILGVVHEKPVPETIDLVCILDHIVRFNG